MNFNMEFIIFECLALVIPLQIHSLRILVLLMLFCLKDDEFFESIGAKLLRKYFPSLREDASLSLSVKLRRFKAARRTLSTYRVWKASALNTFSLRRM